MINQAVGIIAPVRGMHLLSTAMNDWSYAQP